MRFSLSKINFLTILITALLFSLLIGVFSINIIKESYKQRIETLEKNYIEKNKVLVKNEIHRVIKRIETLEKVSYEALKNNLEEKVNIIYNIFNSNNNLTLNQIINKNKKLLDFYKWDNNTGYFYIFDNKGQIIYHGSNENFVNKNIFELMKKNKDLESFINNTVKNDKNFGAYKWYKPNGKIDQLYKKYVFAKKVESLNIYIAAGIYRNEFERSVQNLFFQELRKERFGEDDYGYFWINDMNYKMIMHPIKPELEKTDLEKFRTLDNQYLFRNINKLVKEKNNGYINYTWYKPNSNIEDEKITYVHYINKWNLVIGSGFYLTELKDTLKSEKKNLENSLSNNLQKIFFFISILFIASLIIAWYLSKRIKKVEDTQKEHFNMLEQYQQILDKSAVVSKADLNGTITYINNNFTKVSGYKKEEIIGKPHSIVRHPDTPKSQFKKLWNNIQKGKIWKGIIKNKKKNGKSYYNNTTILPIKDAQGNILEYISSGSDVTELFENRSKLQNIFKTDPLTGLGNRVSLIEKISSKPNGVLTLINIDRFKEINDIHGHKIGDKIIKELGERIFNFLDDNLYLVFRVQADIFAIFTSKRDLNKVIEKIETFMETVGKESYSSDTQNFILSYTCGIANNNENLLTYADMALSEAKNKKLKIKVFDNSMNNIEEFKQNIIWVEKLHLAINDDRIVPFFQPIYNYKTKKIEKYEALMRLIENDNIVPPAEYLDIAKKTKLYPELTYKMIEKTINKFANESLEFSINLSIEDLMNEKLINYLYDYAEQKEVFKRMVLEIVESEEIEDSDQISKIIKRFKQKGSKVAIDDFGSGYSNYEYLISLQADYIKIDGSITKHILDDERTQEVVRSIVKFAKKSNMKTIAEFVSNQELDEKIKELDVDYAQGWYYGKAQKEILEYKDNPTYMI